MTADTTDTAPARARGLIGQPEVVGLIVLAIILSNRWLAPLLDAPSLTTWATVFLSIVVQSVPFLALGVLLSGLISIFLSERVLQKVVPKNPVLGVPVAGVAGVGLPGCECAAVPIAASLMRRGIAPAVALTFLLAAPAVNPAVIVSTAVAFPDQPVMVLARFVASLIVAIAIGWFVLSRGAKLPMRLPRMVADPSGSSPSRFLGTVRHDFLQASGFLVLGAMIAAAINTFVPREVLETVAGQAIAGVLTLALFAFVIALCSEADAFVAASLTAFSDTAKLTFMVVGPAMDVKLASMEAGQFGTAFAKQFVPLVVAVATLSAVGVGAVLL